MAQLYKAIQLTFYNINRNRRLGLSPRSPSAGVATGVGGPLASKFNWQLCILCLLL